MPASAQMTESPINTNTKSSGMRVEGRVTCPSKSTPTDRRYMAVTRNDKERQEMTKNVKVLTRNDERRRRMTSVRTLMIILKLYKETMIG